MSTHSISDPSLRQSPAAVRMVADVIKGPQLLTSETEMERIFFDVVGRIAEALTPGDEARAALRTPAYRKFIGTGDFIVKDILGKCTPRAFAVSVAVQCSKEHGIGSEIESYERMQFNGKWVPVAAQCWFEDVPKNDREGALLERAPEDTHPMDEVGMKLTSYVPVPVRALRWAIEFRDAKGEQDLKFDAHGRPLVSAPQDPGMARVLAELADAIRSGMGREGQVVVNGATALPTPSADDLSAARARIAELEALVASKSAGPSPVLPRK